MYSIYENDYLPPIIIMLNEYMSRCYHAPAILCNPLDKPIVERYYGDRINVIHTSEIMLVGSVTVFSTEVSRSEAIKTHNVINITSNYKMCIQHPLIKIAILN
jgi:hypothetical protein